MARIGNIDLSLKPLNPVLYYALPNQKTIGRLKEASEISNTILLGKVNELEFKLPYEVENNHQLVKNKNIDKLKERYLIKLILGNVEEWYIVNEIEDEAGDSEVYRSVHCYSLAWELNDKIIQYYDNTGGATTILNEGLNETLWSVAYVDSDFDIKHRTFSDITDMTVLDFIYQVAETFGGIVQFDTINRTVSLLKEENIGQNKGLKLSYGRYLKTLNKTSNSDEMTTRLYVYGSEELGIHRVNPTGSGFIEDFSYFMFPFERDVNKNTISSSYYMSDSLCHAILDYQELIEEYKPTFESLVDANNENYSTLTILNGQMSTLQGEKNTLQSQIDLNKGMGSSTSELNSQLAAKQSEINSKQSEIDDVESDIELTNSQIDQLRDIMSIENNFTVDQIQERNLYIIDKIWRDDNIIDDEELFEAGIEQFRKLKQPQPTFSIDIVNFLNIVEEQRNWDKLSLGDTVTIKYEVMGIEVQAKIVEIDFDYEGNNINLTISNILDLRSPEDKVLNKLYESYSTSSNLDMSKYKWNEGTRQAGEINEIINNTWSTIERKITAGVDNSITISGRGIEVRSPSDPNNVLIIQSGIMAISNDNSNTWKHAITANGLVSEKVKYDKILIYGLEV